ncbi:MAG: glycosyltransferase [Lachnospiraceae bacterium]|nr:glycosyltransferase [Lachnospiraceae bacterium]
MKNQTACIVVTYNRKALLASNLQALRNQKEKGDIFVIDNGSTDGTRELLSEWIERKEIIYKNTGKNLGGAGGFAFGIAEAVRCGYSYLWIMDDDTIPYPDALASLLGKAKRLNGEFSFLCSVVKWKDGSFCRMNLPVFSDQWPDQICEEKEGLISVCSCSFVSCLINAEYIKKAGLPIAEFFIYGDDAEYTERLSGLADAYLDLTSFAEHRTPANISDDISRESRERLGRYYYRYRNCFYIAKKKGRKDVLHYLYITCKMLVKILLFSENCRWKRISVLLSGVFAGISFHPVIQYVDR